MKKLVVVAGLMALGSAANAQTISGTAHDMSGSGWGTDQICIFCHTPHNAASGVNQIVPLWNHETTTSTFTPYANPTGSMQAIPGAVTGVSRACLSCHDGTVALDSFGGASGTHFMTGSERLGTDLSNDHPVSIDYLRGPAPAGDPDLNDPATLADVRLFSSKVECASCHNAHNNVNSNFLRVNNSGSALCLRCHNK